MPQKKTLKRAKKAKREGKVPTTQAGEFVGDEMERLHATRKRAEGDYARGTVTSRSFPTYRTAPLTWYQAPFGLLCR
jgi:hypothetical protein